MQFHRNYEIVPLSIFIKSIRGVYGIILVFMDIRYSKRKVHPLNPVCLCFFFLVILLAYNLSVTIISSSIASSKYSFVCKSIFSICLVFGFVFSSIDETDLNCASLPWSRLYHHLHLFMCQRQIETDTVPVPFYSFRYPSTIQWQ